jgi:hypothetical protein
VTAGYGAGAWHTCVLVGSGARCWGANSYGQLGNGDTSLTITNTPVAVVGVP